MQRGDACMLLSTHGGAQYKEPNESYLRLNVILVGQQYFMIAALAANLQDAPEPLLTVTQQAAVRLSGNLE